MVFQWHCHRNHNYTDRCATSAYMQLKFDHFKSIQNLSNQHPNLNYHTRVGTAGAQLEWLLCSSSCKHTAEHQKRLIDYSVAATLAHTQQSSYKWAKNNYCYRASAQLKTECEHIECTRVPSTELNRPWPQQLTAQRNVTTSDWTTWANHAVYTHQPRPRDENHKITHLSQHDIFSKQKIIWIYQFACAS